MGSGPLFAISAMCIPIQSLFIHLSTDMAQSHKQAFRKQNFKSRARLKARTTRQQHRDLEAPLIIVVITVI